MFLSYQELRSNADILKVAKFLGEQYVKKLGNHPKVMMKLIPKTNFEKRKLKYEQVRAGVDISSVYFLMWVNYRNCTISLWNVDIQSYLLLKYVSGAFWRFV